MLDQPAIINAVNRSRISYNEHAFVQNVIAERLLERLVEFNTKPQLIINASAHSDFTDQWLQREYPAAHVISYNLVQQLTEPLPLENHSADWVLANLTLPWCVEPLACLQRWQQWLKPGGLLLFTTLGPATLSELRQSFAAVDTYPHVHEFVDMHDIGDSLLAAQWVNPVMEREVITVEYSALDELWRDLQKTGVSNAHSQRARGLLGKHRWQAMQAHYRQSMPDAANLSASCEIIYGQAWRSQVDVPLKNELGEVYIPLSWVKNRGLRS